MTTLKLNQLVLSIILLLVCAGPSMSIVANDDLPVGQFNYDFGDFISWVDDAVAENKIPGAAIAIVSREGIMHLQTWGKNNVAGSDLVTTDSVFRIASMSKTFAGTAMSLLVDQNLQSWDCLLYTSPSPRDATLSRMPSSA